jgi:mannose-6-phosphate isomerase-like protein (cupin superfamily)
MDFETKRLQTKYDYLAPDGSEIRLLPAMQGGGLAHCALGVGKASQAVVHKQVEEIWYFLEGQGQVWRKQGEREAVADVSPGLALTIPPGTRFQFRNTGAADLCFVIVTMPPWTNADEATAVENYWAL